MMLAAEGIGLGRMGGVQSAYDSTNWYTDRMTTEQGPLFDRREYSRVTSPLPDILFDSKCRRLLDSASNDPRTYLLLLLLLETGLKKAELLDLKITHFDLSNKYRPELWVKHMGRQSRKDRKLKLPSD